MCDWMFIHDGFRRANPPNSNADLNLALVLPCPSLPTPLWLPKPLLLVQPSCNLWLQCWFWWPLNIRWYCDYLSGQVISLTLGNGFKIQCPVKEDRVRVLKHGQLKWGVVGCFFFFWGCCSEYESQRLKILIVQQLFSFVVHRLLNVYLNIVYARGES